MAFNKMVKLMHIRSKNNEIDPIFIDEVGR